MLAEERVGGKPEPTQYFLRALPERFTLHRLVSVAKNRHWIEQDYKQMKEQPGLDHCEGRSWMGWHYHVALVMLVYGFLQRQRRRRWDKRGLDAAVSPA